MAHDRDVAIDILRGLAIFTMVAANMAAYVLAEPHPLALRLYGTFAAPLFIFISGMMIAVTVQRKDHGFKYYLVRGAMVMLVGALIDIFIWGSCPFVTVDVLYLIGLSLPLAYLSLRLNTLSRLAVVIFIFSATPVLQNFLGYTACPVDIALWGSKAAASVPGIQTSVIHHWIIDGWFPVFPWLGFSLLGPVLAGLRRRLNGSFGKAPVLLGGLCVLFFGGMIWRLYPGSLMTREGYSELFYPPTIGYIITAIAVIVTVFSIIDLKPSLAIYRPLRALGESSLFMYVLHLALIRYIIAPVWPGKDLRVFLLIYVVLSTLLILAAYALRALKARWKDRPFVVSFLLGG